jgi:hypothetical protein
VFRGTRGLPYRRETIYKVRAVLYPSDKLIECLCVRANGQLWCCCNTLTISKESPTAERIA